ncbi:N6-adenosine-specific RNA methylase IME4 [Rhizobium sp. PP-F2F-G48]|uniref:MT-A70 family methyltransferase n=1 Tax=Rhizobium sp. PP-F2F-G48 TaxID=2135651 RepID=UPI0010461B77|nr:MT-A70 family methyltransferase [Rhizobium sp. PP-F2F-G48]TCM56170.1 N6-adenosine-specific RNA methylase IME4 [Rhizobium sp. PP-F2F-G48]
MSGAPKLGPTMLQVMRTALVEGAVSTVDASAQKAALSMNGRGLLARLPGAPNRWAPTERARELYPDLVLPDAADDLPHHLLAGLFPLFSEPDLQALAADIAANGQREPIWLLDGQILDGRNRFAACKIAGVAPRLRVFDGGDPLEFVLSLNLHRRHLSESQRAMVAAKIAIWQRGINQTTVGSANLQTRTAARRLSVSERSVFTAKRIDQHGVKALSEAVREGRLTLHVAETLSHLEDQAQEHILKLDKREIMQRAKDERAKSQQMRHVVRLAHMAHKVENGRATAGQVGQKFPVIYADPPWRFGVHSEVTGREKSAENHYPTMTTDEICALWEAIGAPGKRDAVLFLWATNPMLPDALRVMDAWGFAYVHHWIWDKGVAGTGYWGRDRHELLLIGRRGDVASPLPGQQPETVHCERKGAHSVKPAFYAETIERLYPDMPRLEMFCRDARPGWTAWGYEAGSSDDEVAA